MTTDSTGDWTPERIREARERCDKATGGNWHAADCVAPRIAIYAWITREGEPKPSANYLGECYADAKGQGRANMAFIAHARTDLPAALREIERLRDRPTLTEEQIETLTDMIESIESPASEGWTLPSGQNVIIKAPGGHLSIVHTSSLQRWAGKLREILDAARGETGEPGAGDTVWTGVSVIARPAAAKEVP